jgi:hypothetical protein
LVFRTAGAQGRGCPKAIFYHSLRL